MKTGQLAVREVIDDHKEYLFSVKWWGWGSQIGVNQSITRS